MKKVLNTVLIFLCGISVSGQSIEGGTIKYQRIANLGVKPEGEWAEFKRTLPKTRTTNYILYFSDDESVFAENSKENEAPTDMMKKALYFAGQWGRPQVKLMKYYRNQEKNLQVRQTEFMTRLFRELSEMPKLKWKMGIATKEICGYQCMQADIELDGKKILAWFTPDIPVSTGPEIYYGLPGVILEANIDQGKQVWVATSIELSAPSIELLSEPQDGKKVKSDQYKKIQEEKIKEWEKQQKMKKSDKAVRVLK